MKILKDSISIYHLSKECPQTKDIMKNLGFEDIVKPGMLQTAGRFMTLRKGCEFKNINYSKAKLAFNEVGIDFEEEN